MLFNSLVFLYAFLPLTYLVYFRLKGKEQRYIWLTITGYIFYGAWSYEFCFLMAFSTLVSYLAGLGFLRYNEDSTARKLCLIIPVTIDLLLLCFFKYFNFFAENAGTLLRLISPSINVQHFDIVLPVGISFYTFHTISYIVDAYRRKITPTANFFEFSCYVSLFSQLVAGPIVRFGEIERDLDNVGAGHSTKNKNLAWSYFTIGIIKKVLIADTIASVINPALSDYAKLSTIDTWLCMLGYTYQLYFDFSGYSDMAVGLGHLFNIRIPQNFNSPYKAESISDFWRRWHMSLSRCLRDYLYISLGGNRGGKLKTYRNLILTMGIGGLWHGANWTFVIWGLYHGALLSLEKIVPDISRPLLVKRATTFLLVIIGWVLFRATDMPMAYELLKRMLIFTPGTAIDGQVGLVIALSIAALIAHFGKNTFELRHEWRPAEAVGLTAMFLVGILIITSGNEMPFLYFQF